jgi:4'-phosphopantetheinyl transferase
MLDLYWPMPDAARHPADSLPGAAVHLWCAPLDQPQERLAQLAQTLTSEEQRRAARFHLARDQQRFIAGRGLLRLLLGSYLGCPPSGVPIVYGAAGKPMLPTGANPLGLQFNAAHAHGLALFGVTQERALGVDLEWVQPLADAATIAQHFFTPQEAATLQALAPSRRVEAFLRCWTRKEAYLKACGAGLRRPLNEIEVTCDLVAPARVRAREGAALAETMEWALHDLRPGADYIGALVVEAGHGPLTCWQGYPWGYPQLVLG